MRCQILVVIISLAFVYAFTDAVLKPINFYLDTLDNEKQSNSENNQSNLFLLKTDKCETTLIFDLTKNIVTKEVFDISLKLFMRYILKYCNGFKYVALDNILNSQCQTTNTCNVTINDCLSSHECKDIIDKVMNYNDMTSTYSSELLENNSDDSNNYNNFLNQIFNKLSLCQESTVILFTNRIMSNEFEPEITQTIEKANIRLTTILLGRNEINATEFLQNAYENIPNVTTLSLPNYDCLSYLFYCIMPCSNDKPECMQVDIDDCQTPSKWTPNPNPEETLHIWYVLDFAFLPNQNYTLNSLDFTDIGLSMHRGLKDYADRNNIERIRIKVTQENDRITSSIEDIETLYDYLTTAVVILPDDVGDDNNTLNNRLNLIPWSDTLIETRIGILAVIMLTNYATTTLTLKKDGQSLQGSLYIYNPKSYQYYSNQLKNGTNFLLFPLNFTDSVSVTLVKNMTATSTTEIGTISSFDTTYHSNQDTHSSYPSTIKTVFTDATENYDSSTMENKPEKSLSTIVIILIICGALFGVLVFILAIAFVFYQKRKNRNVQMQALYGRRSKKGRDETTTTKMDDWELTWDKLIVHKEIYIGAYSKILQGKLRERNAVSDDGVEVAIKISCKQATQMEKMNFLKEVSLMKLLSGNTNIVKMYGCITTGDEICLILEFCSNFDLLNFVKAQHITEETYNLKTIRKTFFIFAWQIVHGLKYLESQRIIHRNLTARNILIDTNKNAKISDFGLAIESNKNDEIVQDIDKKRLPAKWMAIESLKNFKFSFASDIWSFGIVLYEMYSFGEIPYADIKIEEQLEYLEAGTRLTKPDFCYDEIYEIILRCWAETVASRPPATEIIQMFTEFLKRSTEGYGYLEVLEAAAGKDNKELIRQLSSMGSN